jgi:hypothetical protein
MGTFDVSVQVLVQLVNQRYLLLRLWWLCIQILRHRPKMSFQMPVNVEVAVDVSAEV